MFAFAFLLVKPGLFFWSIVGNVTIILGYSGDQGSLGNQKWFSLSDIVNYWAAKRAWIQADASVLKLWEDSTTALVILSVCVMIFWKDSNIDLAILEACVMIFWGDSNIGLVILLVPPNALRRLQ